MLALVMAKFDILDRYNLFLSNVKVQSYKNMHY